MSDQLRLEIAAKQIEFAKRYNEQLYTDVPHDDWFRIPDGCVTHIGWQVGHLAVAQYGLMCFRQRGRLPIDRDLLTNGFRKQFGKGSTPVAGAENNPTPTEILETAAVIHKQAMKELAENDGSTLNDPCDMPTAGFPTKYGALLFCAHHEMLHAGQIGMLRRMLGREPLR